MGSISDIAVAQNEIININKKLDDHGKVMGKGFEEVKRMLSQQNQEFEKRFVTMDAFRPVRNISYGLVSALGAVVLYYLFGIKH